MQFFGKDNNEIENEKGRKNKSLDRMKHFRKGKIFAVTGLLSFFCFLSASKQRCKEFRVRRDNFKDTLQSSANSCLQVVGHCNTRNKNRFTFCNPVFLQPKKFPQKLFLFAKKYESCSINSFLL